MRTVVIAALYALLLIGASQGTYAQEVNRANKASLPYVEMDDPYINTVMDADGEEIGSCRDPNSDCFVHLENALLDAVERGGAVSAGANRTTIAVKAVSTQSPFYVEDIDPEVYAVSWILCERANHFSLEPLDPFANEASPAVVAAQ